MSRSFFAKLHRRFGPKLSGAELYGRAHAKQTEFARWLGLASLPPDCGKVLPNGVAVVGGGFAGLAAAWTLGQAGIASTVFEARKTYGGRVESDRSSLSPCRVIERGAELIGFNHPMWIDLAKRFGLGFSVLTGEDQYAAMGLEMPLRIGGKTVPDPEKLYEQMAFVLQKISNDAKVITDPFAPWTTPGAAALDRISVADKITTFVRLLPNRTPHPMLREALELQLGNDNVLPTKEQSYLGLLALVSGGKLSPDDVKLNGYWEHNEDFRCAEGNDRLAGMMLEYGKRILFRPSSPVTKIEIGEKDPRVTVTWLDSFRGSRSQNFDYVILTAPPSVWKKIAITPVLPPGREMALGPAVKFISHVHDRFWIKAGMAPSGASNELGQTWEVTENQALASQGVALSVFAGGAFVPKSDAPKHFMAQLQKLYPGYRMKVGYYADWPSVPWIETGYSCPKVGQVTTVGKELSVPHKQRLYFAGEHTCMAYFGYMEGALQSGARAAKDILATCTKVSSRSVTRERRVHEYQRAENVAAASGSWNSRYSNDAKVVGVYGELAPGQVGRAAEGGFQEDFSTESDFGEEVLAAAEAVAESGGDAARSSAAVLEILLGGSYGVESGTEGEAKPLSPLGHQGPAPSATTLFNAFVYPNYPLFPRNALHRHYARRFQVLAYPGQAMPDLETRPGDILLRVAQGQGWGHVAIVASRDLYRYDRLGDVGLRGEGYPWLRPGLYIQVVEMSPKRRCLAERFARRLCDGAGLVLSDTLLLRPLSPRQSPWEAEAEPGSDTHLGTAGPLMGGPAERPTTLRRGDAGNAVREAQRRLNRIHADAVVLGLPGLNGCPLVEDGRFGERMEMAVRSFQQQVFGDPAEWDGVIGPKTWAQLDLLTGVGTFNNPPAQATPFWMSVPVSSGTVPESLFGEWNVDAEAGDVNRNSPDYIRWMQSSLNQILGTQLVVDGVIGSKTHTAIRSFQQQRGLTADGIVGRRTDEALRAALAGGVSIPPVTPCTTLDHFPQGSDTILPAHQPILIALARRILAENIRNVDVTGFASSEGLETENIALGQRRADRIAKELRTTLDRLRPGSSTGVTIVITSRGESEQIAGGDLPLNRRVSICLKLPCVSPSVSRDDPTSLNLSPVGTDNFNVTLTVRGTSYQVKGNVFYPGQKSGAHVSFNTKAVAGGKAPIVFIAHGNHGLFHDPANRLDERGTNPGGFLTIPNHRGYEYLQQLLAQMGIISISVDCNQFSGPIGLSPTNIQNRADLVLGAIKHFQSLNSGSDPIFGGHIDYGRVGLMGHSRGGEVVVLVPELLALPGTGISDVTIKGVISIAPTDIGATSGRPTGFAFMTILPAADLDVRTNTGAKFYDQSSADPFKCQLYIHDANHNFFNTEWVSDDLRRWNPATGSLTILRSSVNVMGKDDEKAILKAHGCAFFRTVLLGHNLRKFMEGLEIPPGVARFRDIHISFERTGSTTVDDNEDHDILRNTLGKPNSSVGGLIADEHEFAQTPGAFNSTFFGNTRGMVTQSSTASGRFRWELGGALDLTGREIRVRTAEVYDGSSVPVGATGFKLGLEDARGKIGFVDSDDVSGLPRPYDRSSDDLAIFGSDFTKTMLKTLRFPASCVSSVEPGFDATRVRAILLRMDRNDGRALAFDQLQIV